MNRRNSNAKKMSLQRPRQTEGYAEIYITAGQAAQEIPQYVGAYTLITNWSANGADKRCVADGANDKITIYKDGFYKVSGTFSLSSTTDNVTFQGAAFLDGAIQANIHFIEVFETKTNVENVGFGGFITVSGAPLDVDFRMRHNIAGAVSITIVSGNLNLFYIGGNE